MSKFKKWYCAGSFIFACLSIILTIILMVTQPVTAYASSTDEGSVSSEQTAPDGEDISEGALYFAARDYADSKRMRWFDEKLTLLFRHGGHEFFKE